MSKTIIDDLNAELNRLTMNFTTMDFIESRKDRDWDKYDAIDNDWNGTIKRLEIRIWEIRNYKNQI